MAETRTLAEVWLWGEYLGAVAESDDGAIAFEYSESFRGTGLEPSPLELPVGPGVFTFGELRRQEAFRGLPGLLADALPDRFGTSVIRSYYTARGQLTKALSPVQHLLYVGDRAIGALEFRPAEELRPRPDEEEALEVARLVAEARRVVHGEVDVAIPEIYRLGTSAGGMRPKAVVLFDPGCREIRSAFTTPRPGEIPAILKFDGVGDDVALGQIGRPQPYNRIEAAYALMARDAGIDVVEIEMIESPEGHAHLVVPRFDTVPDGPLHQHTLGGLLHLDYNDVGASSYEEYLRTAQVLGVPPAGVREGFRRMVFNVLAVNQDDHVKNLSFHMDREGRWSLTPAYDLTFARGLGYTATHQMRVRDRVEGITRADLLAVADAFAVKGARKDMERIEEVVGRWPEYARWTGVPEDAAERVQHALEERGVEAGRGGAGR